jgi:hypothetical protein
VTLRRAVTARLFLQAFAPEFRLKIRDPDSRMIETEAENRSLKRFLPSLVRSPNNEFIWADLYAILSL